MLTTRSKLGPYEITGALGAGGMGEVYRARDTRLGRDVALKVLPEAFARDAERMARLRREAQVLASLNHPNIAAIYGFEDSGVTHALVMELVEGSTLADCIAQRAIPLDEALPIARQIAEALEYAHERGIIHRDLKPSNVKLTPEGNAKILDFGLAKALEGDAAVADVSNSPTLSALATRAGFLLGTAAYMSPEQAKGKPADRRADIWAFSVVLFEMLSGKRLFTGETTSDTLAEVLKMEPDWTLLPAATPPRIRELLQRCLKKDPRQRLQSIGDARIAIEEVLSGAAGPEISAVQTNRRAGIRERVAWMAAAVLLIVAALFAAGYFLRAPATLPAVVSEISAPEGTHFVFNGSSGIPVLSPDGQMLAFLGEDSQGRRQLWIRRLDSDTAQPLAGTDDGRFPFWSPDSRYLAFFEKSELMRIAISGGPAISVAAMPAGIGGAWGRSGTLLATPTPIGSIWGVSASGGTPYKITTFDKSRLELIHVRPQFLPDGKHFLFFAVSVVRENSGTYAASLSGGSPKLVLRNDSAAVYAVPNFLLFVRGGTLMVQHFDLNSLSVSGDPMPLAVHVSTNATHGIGLFTVSENGILAYEPGNVVVGEGSILWLDRNGKQIEQTGINGEYGNPSISPDGDKVAVSFTDPTIGKPDIWIFDVARGVKTRLTLSPSLSADPVWSPDGKKIAFLSNRAANRMNLYEKAADGTGPATPLVVDDSDERDPSWSVDGRYLLFTRKPSAPHSHLEIWAVPFNGERKPFVVLRGQFNLHQEALSPDGKWLVYVSDESGRPEVYVAPFLRDGGKFLVSTNGGNYPMWRRDGKEIFYRSSDQKIMSVPILERDADLAIGKAQTLFQSNVATGGLGAMYSVTADGKKFVVSSQGPEQAAVPLKLVVNWPALLKNPR